MYKELRNLKKIKTYQDILTNVSEFGFNFSVESLESLCQITMGTESRTHHVILNCNSKL